MKAKVLLLIVFVFCLFGVTSVNALTESVSTLKTITNYSLAKGATKSYSGLFSSLNYARASLTVNSVTSEGETYFEGYRLESSSYLLKDYNTIKLVKNSCQLIKIGKIGFGTWKLSNSATDKYVGWSGELEYMSSSVE